jgi:carotenoid cleavage dioxygenase
MVNDESHCEIFDAADPTVGPIARVKLPERISSGTHATWAPASQLT